MTVKGKIRIIEQTVFSGEIAFKRVNPAAVITMKTQKIFLKNPNGWEETVTGNRSEGESSRQ